MVCARVSHACSCLCACGCVCVCDLLCEVVSLVFGIVLVRLCLFVSVFVLCVCSVL